MAYDRTRGHVISTILLGRYFISYRRSTARATGTAEAERVRDALRDRGAPTWRDLDDLASKPTESELVETLSDPYTAGAVMLVSPEIADSTIVRNVEAPRIFQRARKNDGFIVKPVLIQLKYAEADTTLGSPAGFQDIGGWNVRKIDTDELTPEHARSIARDIVSTRLAAVANNDSTAGLTVGLYSRRMPSSEQLALRWDYSSYFNGRSCADGTYSIIERGLLDSASAVLGAFNNPCVSASGFAALPLGVLFGSVFSPLAGFQLTWRQPFEGQADDWSVSATATDIELDISKSFADPESEDVVLALGISASIESAVAEYLRDEGIRPRAAMHVAIEAGSVPQGHRLTPGEGLSVVYQAVEAVRQVRDEYGLARVRLHLFLACPLGMAVLLGQKLNTFSSCVLYEHDPDTTPTYNRVHEFAPSGFDYSES